MKVFWEQRFRNPLISHKFLKQILKELPVRMQKINSRYISSYHLFVIKMINIKNIKNYDKIFNYLRKKKNIRKPSLFASS